MAKNEMVSVKDAVYKLQLSLLEGVRNPEQLFAAGSLLSASDYKDIVIERSIANTCGYPLCVNPLPSDRPKKGRYRISLKEHKVYDLHETYLYCSTRCVVNSRTFAEGLQEERSSTLDSAHVNGILRLFEGLSLETKDDLGKNGDLGFSKLKIQENLDVKNGEVFLKEWIGPSNAIEGYVPQRDRGINSSRPKIQKEGSKFNESKPNKGKSMIFNDMDFTSTIITQDEYSVSKTSSDGKATDSYAKSGSSNGEKGSCRNLKNKTNILGLPAQGQSDSGNKPKRRRSRKNASVKKDVSETLLKPSLKSVGAKKEPRCVTWADDKNVNNESKNLCEFRKLENTQDCADKFVFPNSGDDSDLVRFASAEACAMALSQAAKAVASGDSDASDAVSEAGIIVLPPPNDMDKEYQDDVDMLESEPTPKWPTKAGVPNYNLFESEDSWFDLPPEGFIRTLSSFGTMWSALFEWISSSSLAYIYGRDDSFHEEYLSANGREYPQKIVLSDGLSSEIKQTLAECLSRALPGLVADLRLPIPISTIERAMGRLVDTMSFVDPLPAFNMKQWQVIVLLFIDALSVSRIPALAPHMTGRRTSFHKVLDSGQITTDEYAVMKDLAIPLGRVPEFSAQSGG